MIQREHELEQSAVAQRALLLPTMDRRAARHQLQLRVVREVGLPDTATEVLHNAHFYYPSALHSGNRHHLHHLTHTHLNLHGRRHPLSSSHLPRPFSHHGLDCKKNTAVDGVDSLGNASTSASTSALNGAHSLPAPMHLDLMIHMSPSHHSKHSPPSLSPSTSYSPLEVSHKAECFIMIDLSLCRML